MYDIRDEIASHLQGTISDRNVNYFGWTELLSGVPSECFSHTMSSNRINRIDNLVLHSNRCSRWSRMQ